MGQWSNLPFAELEPFLASLRHSGFAGEVCIFVTDVAPETVRQLQDLGVRVERPGQSAQPRMTHLSSRFFTYLDFLVRHGTNYRHVMLTDLRDVVFQADPFAVALPADIVFAQERCRLANCPVNRAWVVQGYGNAVADNMRDCLISCAGTTFGTVGGILRYLTAMTSELTSRPVAIEGGIDQGVHNYIVHMRPLGNAWLDTSDSIAATMHYVPVEAVTISPRRVDRRQARPGPASMAEAYRACWLCPVRYTVSSVASCTGAWTGTCGRGSRRRNGGRLLSSRARCRLAGSLSRQSAMHWVPGGAALRRRIRFRRNRGSGAAWRGDAPGRADGCLRADRKCRSSADQPGAGQDCRRQWSRPGAGAGHRARGVPAQSVREQHDWPFGVLRGRATDQANSDDNLHRLAMFLEDAERFGQRPIVSSMLFRGRMEHVRAFYRRLLIEFVGRAELLRILKSIQGAVNKLCHGGGFEFPIVLHANAAETLFDFWPSGMQMDMRPDIRVGGAVPAIVLGDRLQSEVMSALRRSLGIGL